MWLVQIAGTSSQCRYDTGTMLMTVKEWKMHASAWIGWLEILYQSFGDSTIRHITIRASETVCLDMTAHSLSRVVVPAMLHHTSVNAWKIVPKSHDHHYRFQSHDQNIVVLVDGMFQSIFHFVYQVIVFNFYLHKIVLQEVGEGGK